MKVSIPHPFPYQGSKRAIAGQILPYFPSDTSRLIEPFCGSGAVSIAAAYHGLVNTLLLNDTNAPLMNLWAWILENPERLAEDYGKLWNAQRPDRKEFFYRIRDEFNASHIPDHMLYLLARIVKGSVRYSSEGTFNQSADNRRWGMRPEKMRRQILGVSSLLSGKTSLSATDFRDVVFDSEKSDLIYMDPPYQGTSSARDRRYFNSLAYDDFVNTLSEMNNERLSYIVSYDGQTGEKIHGKRLPSELSLVRKEIHAGRSSQATLLGANRQTMESLYLSPVLVDRLDNEKPITEDVPKMRQKEFALT